MIYYHEAYPDLIKGEELDNYLAKGWFRMREYISTESHLIDHDIFTLNKVWWIRFILNELCERKSHKQIRKNNKSFTHIISDLAGINDNHGLLFEKYKSCIPFETYGDYYEAIWGDGGKNPYDTKCIEVYDENKLIAVGIFDIGKITAEAILHFYDPVYEKHSLGKYLVLLTADYLRENKFKFYYPGYVVCDKPRFNYKLFLGEEIAQYYEPEKDEWLFYNPSILNDKKYTDDEVIDFFVLTIKKGKKDEQDVL